MEPSCPGVADIVVMRDHCHTGTNKVIKLVESIAGLPLVPMLMFPSTIQMNFVSEAGVGCMYPCHAFNRVGELM